MACFGWHIRRGPHHHALLGQAGAVYGDGQTEVGYLRRAVFSQQDVAGLEVPVHDALGVCELQAATHLAGYLEGPFQGNPVFWRIVNQPLDVVRHQRQDHVGLAVLITEVMYRQDVGVVAEPAHRLGLSGDAGPGGLVQSLGLDEREGHVPVQDAVVGQVDLLLAALRRRSWVGRLEDSQESEPRLGPQ